MSETLKPIGRGYIKFRMETPGYVHERKTVRMHLVTADQESAISNLFEEFSKQVFGVLTESPAANPPEPDSQP